MRILVLTNMYPPHAYGGYERSCRDVVERWRDRGHEVMVLTSSIRVGDADAREGRDSSFVRRELEIYWRDHELLRPALLRRFRIERANIAALDRALSEFEPQVTSVWAMGAMSMGLLSHLASRSVPVVSVVCDEWPVYGPAVDAWLSPLERRRGLARVVGVLSRLPTSAPPIDQMGPSCFVSRFLLDKVREASRWSFPGATVVYSGVAYEEFAHAQPVGEWCWRLLYVGRIDPRKGIDTAIGALARLPRESTLTVCGRGDERHLEELKTLAKELGLSSRVSFTSSARSSVWTQYAQADAVVFPPVWDEPFGLVPLEAMATATPVVATATGGSAEFLVDRRNCLVFERGDAESLAARLTELARDERLRRKLVDGGLETAERFSADTLAEVLERWHLYASGEASQRPEDRTLGAQTSGVGA
jgi:glycogen(starch) synthase